MGSTTPVSSRLFPEEVIHYQSYKLPFAYPVLEVGFEEKGSESCCLF